MAALTRVGAPSTAGLIVDAVEKSYGEIQALKGVSFTIERGSVLCVLGRNGAGKSTLLSIIVGNLRADKGAVTLLDHDVSVEKRAAQAQLGYAPQVLGIYPVLSVRHNLTFFGELSGLRRDESRMRADEVADMMQLEDLLDRRAGLLSGGEKRRLHVAAALLSKRPIIVLDEPTAGVDIASRHLMMDVVRALADAGSAVLVTTHHLDEAEGLGAEVAILEEGCVLQRGAPAQLIDSFGETVVELRFEDSAPEIATLADRAVHRGVDGQTLEFHTDHPDRALERALTELGDARRGLLGIEVVRPSLDNVFMALTGQRYAVEEDD